MQLNVMFCNIFQYITEHLFKISTMIHLKGEANGESSRKLKILNTENKGKIITKIYFITKYHTTD